MYFELVPAGYVTEINQRFSLNQLVVNDVVLTIPPALGHHLAYHIHEKMRMAIGVINAASRSNYILAPESL